MEFVAWFSAVHFVTLTGINELSTDLRSVGYPKFWLLDVVHANGTFYTEVFEPILWKYDIELRSKPLWKTEMNMIKPFHGFMQSFLVR